MSHNIKLPNLLIIGAAKSGTTSLHEYLSQHPDVFMSNPKEPHFFADFTPELVNPLSGNYGDLKIMTLADYENLFIGSDEYKIVGESSVSTLFFPHAIKRASDLLNKPKIIIMLRNPIDRAYSNYMHHVRDSYENLSFEKALEMEEERLHDNYWWGYQLRKASLYYEQIANVYKYIPKENVKIILFENFIKSKNIVLQEVCCFLDINSKFEFDTNFVSNISGRPRTNSTKVKLYTRFFKNSNLLKSLFKYLLPIRLKNYVVSKAKRELFDKELIKEKMVPQTREELKSFFRNDILKLSELINMDLSFWLK